MDKEFKIELPELKINQEQREKEIKGLIKNDFERGGLLAHCLTFTYLYEPVSVSELTDKLTAYYKTNYERTNIFRVLQRLTKMGLIYSTTSGLVLSMGHHEQKDIHKLILAKFQRFLSKIPEPFKKRYSDVNYFWVANGEGTKYIEWVCKLLGFKCENVKNKNS